MTSAKIPEVFRRCPFCSSQKIRKPFRMTEIHQIYRCQDCRLEFKEALSKDKLQVLYDREYECLELRKDQAIHMESRLYLAERYVDNIVHELGIDLAKARVLDYGAGPGNVSEALRKAGADVTAVENNEFALKNLSARGIQAQPTLNGLRNESFDLVLCVEVLEHLRSPWQALEDLRRLLKPEGVIYISTPNNRGANALIHRGRWREYLKSAHFFFFNAHSITRLLLETGYSSIQRCRWRLDFQETAHHSSMRDRLQGLLQTVQMDGGLRYIARKARED